jgi:hypothetical protein
MDDSTLSFLEYQRKLNARLLFNKSLYDEDSTSTWAFCRRLATWDFESAAFLFENLVKEIGTIPLRTSSRRQHHSRVIQIAGQEEPHIEITFGETRGEIDAGDCIPIPVNAIRTFVEILQSLNLDTREISLEILINLKSQFPRGLQGEIESAQEELETQRRAKYNTEPDVELIEEEGNRENHGQSRHVEEEENREEHGQRENVYEEPPFHPTSSRGGSADEGESVGEEDSASGRGETPHADGTQSGESTSKFFETGTMGGSENGPSSKGGYQPPVYKVKSSKFKGRQGEQFCEFIESFASYAKLCAVPDEALVDCMLQCLRGEAGHSARAILRDKEDAKLEDLVEALRLEFAPASTQSKVEATLWETKKEEGRIGQ